MMGSMLRRGAITTGCAADDAPGQVGGLTATASGTTTINLQWNADGTAAPNTATSYEVERSIDGINAWSVIGTVSAPTVTFSDTSLSANTTRFYRVVSYNCLQGALPSATANATTAAGSISPSWSLDFSTGTPSGYTLTRASSATRVDSSGYIASSSTDVARLTHNSSGSRLGLLVEEQRTNVATWSNNSTQWIVGGLTYSSTNNSDPQNTNTAIRIQEDATTGGHVIGPPSAPTTANPVFSIFVKKDNRQYFHMYLTTNFSTNWIAATFDLDNNGAVTQQVAGSGSTYTGAFAGAETYANGWIRLYIGGAHISTSQYGRCGPVTSATPTVSNPGLVSYTGNTANGTFVFGMQLENGSRPTSYIATTTATVTRSADLAHVLDSSITSWGNPGALVVHFYLPGQAGTLISTDDASTAQVGIEASTTTAARAFWSSGSTSTGTIGTGVQKAVHYWNGSTSKFCINGGTVQSGTNNLTIANTDFVTLGAEATDSSGVPGTFSQYANCIIRKVEFYSGTLTDANLQTITT